MDFNAVLRFTAGCLHSLVERRRGRILRGRGPTHFAFAGSILRRELLAAPPRSTGKSLRSSAKDFRIACGELFLYAWDCCGCGWLIAGPAREAGRDPTLWRNPKAKHTTNATQHAPPPNPLLPPPRSGFVQPCAAANPAGASWLQSLRPVRRVAERGSRPIYAALIPSVFSLSGAWLRKQTSAASGHVES
jgi:hypothetical protein